MYMYSPGLRPNGMSGSFLDGPMVKGPYFQLILGAPPAQKLHVVECSKTLVRPFGVPRLDSSDFWLHRAGVQK